MKKIILYCIFAVSCFAELQVAESKTNDMSPHLFFGAGLGTTATMTRDVFDNVNGVITHKNTLSSLALSGKVGGYNQLTKILSLRYYYNLDLDFNFGQRGVFGRLGFYTFSQTHTLNADVIVNVLRLDQWDLDLIGGMGLGIFRGAFGLRDGTVYFEQTRNTFLDFVFRANVGLRVMFDQKYGLEFVSKIPLTPETAVFRDGIEFFIRPYFFTFDFVMKY